MIDDGDNVILSDDLRTKLYMTADEMAQGIDVETGNKGPTYGMTAAQRKRYEKKMLAKPRPRDIFDVQALIKKRYEQIEAKNKKLAIEAENLQNQKFQPQAKVEISEADKVADVIK